MGKGQQQRTDKRNKPKLSTKEKQAKKAAKRLPPPAIAIPKK